ncbi:serine hydrolase domain-containing protein [Brevundimonas sp.]|uniref:serine hydrolase domain-containing protein n=1 Tax=Brevundimonas sp. TaxID=1871086 RepID=UPI002D3BC0CF|nr:serine hydrolase domain-containing protein [Brevundimonas sp.]HYC68960.1 serine hydrolase domain-containing protein [Brevundimonas sp.]
MPRPVHSAWITDQASGASAGAFTSLFPWWSFTKTVLAVAALRLVEAGELDLDVPRPGRAYTLRQLLAHRAGVPNYGGLPAYSEAVARNEDAWSRRQLLDAAGADRLLFQPGTGWAYSNIGYLFVREAIEEATGRPLAAALRDLVLDPLGLKSARLAVTRSDFRQVQWPAPGSYDPAWVYHGCLIGSAPDAAGLLHAVLGGALLESPSVLLERRTSLDTASRAGPWTECGYALGLMIGRMGEAGRAIGHSGAGPGGTAAVYHFPDLDRPVTVAAFTDDPDEGVAEAEALAVAVLAQA